MIDYNLSQKGSFTNKIFQLKIKEAKEFLKENNFDVNLKFEEVRNSKEISYTINGIGHFGNYITYSIKTNNKLIANLNCFLNTKKDFIEIVLNKI